MGYEILDPRDFLNGEPFSEKGFLERASAHDWGSHRDRQVLVRGCDSIIIPPWAYMLMAARLAPYAKTIRFGNEHENILVNRRPGTTERVKTTDE